MADQPLPTIRCRQCGHAVAQWDQKCPLCGSPIEENVQAQSEATRWWLAGAGQAAPAPAGPAPSGTANPYGARSTPQIAAAPESRGQQAQEASQSQKASAALDAGKLHLANREYDAAIGDFTEAIRLAPKNRDAFSNRAFARLYPRDYDRVAHDLSAAIRLQPRSSLVANRALESYGKRDYAQAVEE